MIGERLVKLTKDTIVYGFGSALTSVIGVILVPILTRILTPGQYGILDLLSTIVFLSTVLLSFGFDSALGLLFYRQDDETYRRDLLSTATVFVVGATAVLAVVGTLLSRQLTNIIIDRQTSIIPMLCLMGVIPFNLLQSFVLTGLRFRFRKKAYLAVITVNVVLTVVLTLWFVVGLGWGVSGYAFAWLITLVCSSLTGVAFLGTRAIRQWQPKLLRQLLAVGLPLVPAGLAGWSLSLIDRFFVKHISVTQLGYYALAVKVSSILGLAIAALQLAWGPFAMSIAEQPEAKATYSRVLTLYTALAGWLSIFLTVLAPVIVRFLSGNQYHSSVQAIAPLLIGTMAYGAYSIVAIGVSIAKKTSHISWTTTLAAAVNVGLNFILIPRYGFVGAAIATAISYLLSTFILALVSQHYYPIPFRFGQISIIVLLIAASLAVVVFGPASTTWSALIGTIVLAVYSISLFAIQALDRRQLSVVFSAAKSYLRR